MNTSQTFQKLINRKRNNFPKTIIIHHTGGTRKNPLADTSNHTFETVEKYHLSKRWIGIGYHYFIDKKGLTTRGRPAYVHGAHTFGFNKTSIGICLAGNFDLSLPTPIQVKSLVHLLNEIHIFYEIDKVIPHRKYAYKSCYGSNLSDEWCRKLLEKPTIEYYKSLCFD